MLSPHDIVQIRKLFSNGCTIRQIADIVGVSRATVKRYVMVKPRKPRVGVLDEHALWLRRAFFAEDGNCNTVTERLANELKVVVSSRTVRRFCEQFRDELEFARNEAHKRYAAMLDSMIVQGRPLSRKQLDELHQLQSRGFDADEISRATGHARATVKKYLGDSLPKKRRPSPLLAHRDWVLNEFMEANGNVAELHRRFEATFGIEMNPRTFRRQLESLRAAALEEEMARAAQYRDEARTALD